MRETSGHDFVIDRDAPNACTVEPVVDDDLEDVVTRFAFSVTNNREDEWQKYVGPSLSDGCGTVTPRFHARILDAECRVEIEVRVLLLQAAGLELFAGPDARATQENIRAVASVWGDMIRAQWSGKHPLGLVSGVCDGCREYSVSVDVRWLFFSDPANDRDVTVTVNSGSEATLPIFARESSFQFWMEMDPAVVAHEFGHWIGLLDEYKETSPDMFFGLDPEARDFFIDVGVAVHECPGRWVSDDPTSIMYSAQSGHVKSRHYQPFADWLSQRKCCQFGIADPGPIGFMGGGAPWWLALDVSVVGLLVGAVRVTGWLDRDDEKYLEAALGNPIRLLIDVGDDWGLW